MNEHLSLEVLQKQFQEILEKSVRDHLVSDVPVAMMCSGGVDSSLLAAMIRKQMPFAEGYVADVKGTAESEGEKAKKVASLLDFPIHQVRVDREDYLKLWARSIWHNDQPNRFRNEVPFLAVAEACKKDGIKVLLTGEGADELFGGYPWHVEAFNVWKRFERHQCFISQKGIMNLIGKWMPRSLSVGREVQKEHPFSYASVYTPNGLDF
ncbi:MAG: asparagine synthase, partial [Candidatus Omnitrophica bacterium]|nr:asparagine synthase [Candidatus Omnitrophota bacterium]